MKEFHIGLGPFIKDKNSTSKIMFHLIIALIPIIIFSFIKNGVIPYNNGYINLFEMFYPIIFVLVGALSSFIFETLYSKFISKKDGHELKNEIKHSYSIFPGLFLSLILPINTPILLLIFGCFVATVVGKMLFGGFGNNIFNPALIGALFIMAMYSVTIVDNGGYLNSYELDTIASATPLSNVVEGVGSYDELVKPYGDLWTFFVGFIPGAIGETSTLLCLLAFLYLSIFKVIKWKIPVVYIGTVFIMTYMIGGLNDLGIWYPLFQIMSGGLMFGAIFMATDPVTSPTTPIGQVVFGLFLGILTVVFRYLTPYPEGVMTAILTMNMLVFIIDKIGYKARLNFNKAVLTFVVAWVLIVALSIQIANGLTVEHQDANFKIIEKNKINNQTVYIVTQKGFAGDIEAKITFIGDSISKLEIVKQNESYYARIIDADYINKLINEQDNIKELDTISGATITANALKSMLINTINDYEGGK